MASDRILDFYLDINIVLIAGAALWFALCPAFRLGEAPLSHARRFQSLKGMLILIAASPVLAAILAPVQDAVMPGGKVTLGDLMVGSFLRGDIAMDAIAFERLLLVRGAVTQDIISFGSPVLTVVSLTVLACSAIALARLVLAMISLRRVLRDSFLWRRLGPVDIRLSTRATVPFAALALGRRVIVLPQAMLADRRDLRLALAHECQHVRNADPQWEVILETLRPLFCLNPGFIVLKREFDRLRELACDEKVLQSGRFSARHYAECLLRFCEATVRRSGHPIGGVALTRARGRRGREFRSRLLALMTRLPARRGTVRAPLLVAMAALLIAQTAVLIKPSDRWSHDRIMLATVVNLERLEAIDLYSQGAFQQADEVAVDR